MRAAASPAAQALPAFLLADWPGVIACHDPASRDPGAWLRYGVALLRHEGRAELVLAALRTASDCGASREQLLAVLQQEGLAQLGQALAALGLESEQQRCSNLQGRRVTPLPLGPQVCLTVIAARLPTLPQVIDSLRQQSLPPGRIDVYLSEEPHLIDTGLSPEEPILQELAADPLVQLHWVPNSGPYRKFIHALRQPLPLGGEEGLLLTVDDDTLYPPRFVEYLVRNRRKYGCVVAHRGRRIRLAATGEGFAPYGQWHDGLHEPRLANLPTGQSGVLYCRSDFPADLQLEAALALAPTHDDLWLRWLTASRGVPAVILQPNAAARTAELAFPTACASRDYAAASLWFTYNAAEAPAAERGGNDAAVRAIDAYFRCSGFDLAEKLRQEQELQADFY